MTDNTLTCKRKHYHFNGYLCEATIGVTDEMVERAVEAIRKMDEDWYEDFDLLEIRAIAETGLRAALGGEQ